MNFPISAHSYSRSSVATCCSTWYRSTAIALCSVCWTRVGRGAREGEGPLPGPGSTQNGSRLVSTDASAPSPARTCSAKPKT